MFTGEKFTAGSDALWRINKVLDVVDVSPATWWAWHNEGLTPKGIKISHRITFWRKSEVLAFVERLATGGLKAEMDAYIARVRKASEQRKPS